MSSIALLVLKNSDFVFSRDLAKADEIFNAN